MFDQVKEFKDSSDDEILESIEDILPWKLVHFFTLCQRFTNLKNLYLKRMTGKDNLTEKEMKCIFDTELEIHHGFIIEKNLLQENLIKFSELGYLKLVKLLVDEGAIEPVKEFKDSEKGIISWAAHANAESTNNGFQALNQACLNGHYKIVKFLVKCGVNIHTDFDSVLLSACQGGNTDIAKFLIGKGAQIGHRFDIAIAAAHKINNYEIAKIIFGQASNNNKQEILNDAIENNRLQILKICIENGVVPTAESLALAQTLENLDILKYLDSLNE
jgi:ankyrin repeat protein